MFEKILWVSTAGVQSVYSLTRGGGSSSNESLLTQTKPTNIFQYQKDLLNLVQRSIPWVLIIFGS